MTSRQPSERSSEPTPATARRGPPRWLWIAGPLLVLVLFGAEWISSRRSVDTDNAYVKADKVLVSSQVAGRVVDVRVGQNQRVAKGQLLFRLDPEPLRIALDEAEARLAKVVDESGASRAGVHEADAALRAAESTLAWSEQEYQRQKELLARALVAQKSLDDAAHALANARAERDSAVAALDKARQSLGGGPDAALEQLPDYREAVAVRDRARLDLAHADVTAPVAGIIGNHDLQAGEYLNVGQAAMPLVATDPVWIEANFKETDLARMRVGQEADIRIDSYPGRRWRARIASISPSSGSEFSVLPPQNATGNWVKVVQRIPVKLTLIKSPADAPVLRAGMSAEVSVRLTDDATPRVASAH